MKISARNLVPDAKGVKPPVLSKFSASKGEFGNEKIGGLPGALAHRRSL